MTFVREGYQRLNPTLAHNVSSGRAKVNAERRCRVCGGDRRLTRHHLVPQAWFLRRRQEIRVLRNSNSNIVPVCEPCHRLIDSWHAPAMRLQGRSTIRAGLGPNEVAFILQMRGREWFDRAYPREP